MIISGRRWGDRGAGIMLALWLSGCASPSHPPAPVEDRTRAAPAVATAPAAPGLYRVRPGDTLTRIALDHGQSWRDLARWNQLSNPDRIEVGQLLRVAPPEGSESPSAVVVTPIAEPPVAPSVPAASASTAAAPASAPAASPAPASPPARPPSEMAFAWPAQGPAIAGFDEVRNKGIDIAGRAGDPVLAAADGQVVYAGAGLRGYGNLVIIKHSATYLTAYAHNQRLLVQEDQRVKQGQKIAEMGSSDADRVKLHFEIRRNGKPVDPVKLLPPR
ncbi:MAG: peptidoglycan DD-metalloendopeptidase family protein [Limnohabitans sp.]